MKIKKAAGEIKIGTKQASAGLQEERANDRI